jgi:hypothetical protein
MCKDNLKILENCIIIRKFSARWGFYSAAAAAAAAAAVIASISCSEL